MTKSSWFREFVFAVSLVHYAAPPEFLYPFERYRFLIRWVVVFFVVAMTLSPIQAKVGRFRFVLSGTDYVVDAIAEDKPLWSILHVAVIILATKIYVALVFWGGNIVLFILFRSTVFTYSLLSVIIGFGSVWPVVLVVVLPAVRQVAWYYFFSYFALCGGTCFVSSLGLIWMTSFLWKEVVRKDVKRFIGWK